MNQIATTEQKSLVSSFAAKFGVDGNKMLSTLKATAFRQRDGSDISNEQMMALLVVADQYGLNPFTKEIYAFPDRNNGVIPVIGIDGWSRIINANSQFDGIEFRQSEEIIEIVGAQKCPVWIECVIYRKDRNHPTVVREYLDEVYRAPFKAGMSGPWQTHTKRFLRHKAMIQCARIAFGYVGIYDQDEGERILDSNINADYSVIDENVSAVKDSITSKINKIKSATTEENQENTSKKEEPKKGEMNDNKPMFSFAEIADMIHKAENSDQVDEAISLSSDLPANQIEELLSIGNEKKLKLNSVK